MKSIKKILVIVSLFGVHGFELFAQRSALVILDIGNSLDTSKTGYHIEFTLNNKQKLNKYYGYYNSNREIFLVLDTGQYDLIVNLDSLKFDTMHFNLEYLDHKKIKVRNFFRPYRTFKVNLMESLKDGEHFMVDYSMEDSLYIGNDKLVISRTQGILTAYCQGFKRDLTDEDVSKIDTFFSELSYIKSGNSNRNYFYHITYNNCNYIIRDTSCTIDSYYNLIVTLFGESVYRKIITKK